MVSFLDPSQLRAKLSKGFKGKLLVGTLNRPNGTTVNSHGDTVLTSPGVFRVEGFLDDYTEFYRVQAGIPEGDSKVVLILGNCETEPLKNDVVSFPNQPLMQIRKVKNDPALAHAECQSFKV